MSHEKRPEVPAGKIFEGPDDKPLRDYTREEMHRAIWSLAPKKDMMAGIRFLDRVLKTRGVPGVVQYVNDAQRVLNESGVLLEYDYQKKHDGKLKEYEEHLPYARRGWFDRRDFLATWGCLFTGAAFAHWGAWQTTDQVSGYILGDDEEPEPDEKKTRKHPFRQALAHGKELAEKHVSGPAELLIGAVLIEECIKHWRETKRDDFEEMSNAVDRFGQRVNEDNERFDAFCPVI